MLAADLAADTAATAHQGYHARHGDLLSRIDHPFNDPHRSAGQLGLIKGVLILGYRGRLAAHGNFPVLLEPYRVGRMSINLNPT